MSRVSLRLLGSTEARSATGAPLRLGTQKTLALLAFLAIHAGRPHRRDTLMTLLWGDRPDIQARQSLRQALWRIRGALGSAHGGADGPGAPSMLLVDGGMIALDSGVVEVDVVEFERLAAEGSPNSLARAAELYRGDLMEGLILPETGFDEWLRTERDRLQELALDGLARLLGLQVRAGHDDAAVRTALRLLALDPLQEAVHRTLIRLHRRQGRRGAALRQYQICVELLERELGVEPDSETRELYRDILRQPSRSIAAGDAAPESDATAPEPIIGRAPEVARLHEILSTLDQPSARLVVISGEAGVGKSRLAAELTALALQRNVRVLFASCHQTEQVLPLRPYVEALRGGGIFSERGAIERPVGALSSELSRVFPELGEPAPRSPARPEDHVRLFEALLEVVRRLAERQPLVLVLEDLHWADEMSIRFSAFLARRLGGLPALVAVTVRDDDLEDAPVLRIALAEIDREGLAARLPLASLSEPETVSLVRRLVGVRHRDAWVRAVARRAWVASGGNPFVIVETVRGLAQRRGRGRRRARILPERVREMTAARLARLDPAARHVTSVLAVAGEALPFDLIARASGLGEPEAADIVEQLVRRRILGAAGDRLDFLHDRIRQVADEAVLDSRRPSLHAAVAEALEARHADRLEDVSDRLARHHAQAGVASKAIAYLRQVADVARRRYAFEDAGRALDQARGLVGGLPPAERDRTAIELTLAKAVVLTSVGRFREVLDLLGTHERRLAAVGDSQLAVAFEVRLGLTRSYLGDYAGCGAAADRALAAAARGGDRMTTGQAHYLLVLKSFYMSQPLIGIEHGARALPLLDAPDARLWLRLAHVFLGANHLVMGSFGAALDHLALGEAAGDDLDATVVPTLAMALRVLIDGARGRCHQALEAGRRAFEIGRDAVAGLSAMTHLGYAHLEAGQPAEAQRLLGDAVARFRRLAMIAAAARYSAFLAEAQRLGGDAEAARATAIECVDTCRRLSAWWQVGWAQRTLGRIAEGEGDQGAAERHLREARATFMAIPARFEAARTRLDIARVVCGRGDRTAGAEELQHAVGELTALDVPVREAEARALADRLGVALP